MAMKKVIALMVIMAIFSTTAFAAPLSVAGSQDALSGEISLSSQSFETEAVLFADIQSAALTSEEAQAVEGEGWLNALISGVIGAAIGGLTGAASGAAVSLGALTIPGWLAGIIAGGVSSAVAAYPTNDIVIKGTIK
jgi:outer membrane lipoprotein SlyB